MQGEDVTAWEHFLRGRDLYEEPVDGFFDEELERATKKFQMKAKLTPDGVVGRVTMATAMKAGFDPMSDESDDRSSPNWPPKPEGLQPVVGNEARMELFGRFEFKPSPSPGNPEGIVIVDGWQTKNIVKVPIPQLTGILGVGSASGFYFHRLAARQAQALFSAWEKAGLRDRIRSWAGSWVPRYVRGSRTSLSNHSWGTAFDINASWNPLGSQPALLGKPGCVRELVEISNRLGWYWGGHFTRADGMHFELARPMGEDEVSAVLTSL